MNHTPIAILATAVLALTSVTGCSYVKRSDYETSLAELRNKDAALQADIDRIDAQMASLRSELETRFQGYDTKISQMDGRVRVDMTAHFGYDDATLREDDKPALDEFANVILAHHPEVVITVEGFTDPSGSVVYNEGLGLRRADAVRDYLVSQAGLRPDQVRSVSYGEAENRLLEPHAWGDVGQSNRRVALVVDHAGA